MLSSKDAEVHMLRKKLESLVKKFGPPARAEKLDGTAASALRGYIPDEFVDFFVQYGIGTWLKSKFQFCHCDVYADVCRLVLDMDLQFSPEHSAIFGFTAFGEVFIWNRAHMVVLQVKLARQIASADSVDRKRFNPELDISNSLAFIDKNYTDMREEAPDAPLLFDRTVKKLGELDLGEVYGFAPALAMGGSAKLEALRRMKALEHLAFLAELGRAKLMNCNDGKEQFVRVLGSPS